MATNNNNSITFEYLTPDEIYAKLKLYARLMDYGHNVQKVGFEVAGSFKRLNGATLEIEWTEVYHAKAFDGQDFMQIKHNGKWENVMPLIEQVQYVRFFER